LTPWEEQEGLQSIKRGNLLRAVAEMSRLWMIDTTQME
jgi:hypothetical protein